MAKRQTKAELEAALETVTEEFESRRKEALELERLLGIRSEQATKDGKTVMGLRYTIDDLKEQNAKIAEELLVASARLNEWRTFISGGAMRHSSAPK